MATQSDDLELNPFYRTLQASFPDKFEEAQRKCWIICVPCARCLRGEKVTGHFIDTHIFRPSPYFKGQFISTDKSESRTIEIEEYLIRLVSETVDYTVNIVTEELSYNQNYQPFKMYIIDMPLDPSLKKKNSVESQQRLVSEEGEKPKVTSENCKAFLHSFPEHHLVLLDMERKIQNIKDYYVFLCDYLHDAAVRLQEMVNWASGELAKSHQPALDYLDPLNTEIKIAVECCVLKQVHTKLFPVIRQQCFEEDRMLGNLLKQLHDFKMTADQLGVPEKFCCPLPRAIVELAELNNKNTPREKLLCLSNTLEVMMDDVASSFKDAYGLFVHKPDLPNLTSDDLIPLLVTVLVQARPEHLESNLYFVQNFIWELSPKDKQSFILVTFQAAKEFIKSHDFSHMKPSNNKVKKEMSLEELMRVSVQMQNHNSNVKTGIESRPDTRPEGHPDRQLEKIAKMIENSTKEFQEQEETCKNKINNTPVNQSNVPQRHGRGDGLGEFLQGLQQNCLAFSFGKQT